MLFSSRQLCQEPRLLDLRTLFKVEEDLRSLHTFVTQAWSILEADGGFKDGWHIRGLCRHLEGVADGRVGDLLINVPPGCMKSLLASVFWPCWVWRKRPETRWLFASYSLDLSTRDSVARRKILTSPWYRRTWPCRLRPGDNRKTRFHNVAGGWMLATSIAGAGTGEHPDYIVIDDPHSAEQAESEAERASVRRWWDNTISTRGVIRDVKRVVVMQRLHRDDLSGHLLAKGRFTHLCLPMEFEPDRMLPTPLGWNDERRNPGDLLWPAGFPAEEVVRLKQTLTASRWEGQLQQRPPDQDQASEFPASYFGESIWFDELPPPEREYLRVMALDPSVGRAEGCDYSAFIMLFMDVEGRMWVEADLERRDIMRISAQAAVLAKRFRPRVLGVEANGFQALLCEPLREAFAKEGITAELDPIHNVGISKQTRVRSLSGAFARGEILFKRNNPGTLMLVEQLRLFPNGRFDDGPDALEMAVRTAHRCQSPQSEVMFDFARA